MIKWQMIGMLGVVFGIAGIGWGYAQQKQAPGFYELRVYTALPGKRDALAERFANHTAVIFARHGITNVGYWIPHQGDPDLGISAENTFIYIRGYPSKEERDKRLAARAEDPEFLGSSPQGGGQSDDQADRQGAQHRHGRARAIHSDHAREVAPSRPNSISCSISRPPTHLASTSRITAEPNKSLVEWRVEKFGP